MRLVLASVGFALLLGGLVPDSVAAQPTVSGANWKACHGEPLAPPAGRIAACTDVIGKVERSPAQLSLAHLYRARAYRDQREDALALADYDAAIRLDPRNARAYAERGQVFQDGGDDTRALPDFEVAIRLSSDYAFAYNGRGVVRANRGEDDLALADYGKAIALQPGFVWPYNNRAVVLQRRGDRAAAMKDLNRVLAMKPDYGSALVNRGLLHADLGDDPRALADLDEAVRLYPAFKTALINRANFHSKRQRYDLATADLQRVVATGPDANVLSELGSIYSQTGQFDLALDAFAKSLALDPDNAATLNNRCWARATAGRDLDLAREDCDRAVALEPADSDFADSRGLVQLRLGNATGAIADYDRALAADPKNASALYGRGLAKTRAGADGRGDLEAALAIDAKVADEFARYGFAR